MILFVIIAITPLTRVRVYDGHLPGDPHSRGIAQLGSSVEVTSPTDLWDLLGWHRHSIDSNSDHCLDWENSQYKDRIIASSISISLFIAIHLASFCLSLLNVHPVPSFELERNWFFDSASHGRVDLSSFIVYWNLDNRLLGGATCFQILLKLLTKKLFAAYMWTIKLLTLET